MSKSYWGKKIKIKNNNSAAVAQICGLMSQNPEPDKSLILYAVNTSNNHLCVLFKYLSWDVNYVIKYQSWFEDEAFTDPPEGGCVTQGVYSISECTVLGSSVFMFLHNVWVNIRSSICSACGSAGLVQSQCFTKPPSEIHLLCFRPLDKRVVLKKHKY